MAAIEEREKFEKEVLEVSKFIVSKPILGTLGSFDEYGKIKRNNNQHSSGSTS